MLEWTPIKLRTITKNREISETKTWFFEKINKNDKSLVRLTKKKPINETGNITIDLEIKRTYQAYRNKGIIRE